MIITAQSSPFRASLLAAVSIAGLLGSAAAAQTTAPTPGTSTAPAAAAADVPPAGTTSEGAGNTQPTALDSTAQPPADPSATGDEIVVSGYRASLESQTNAKRNSVGFTDTIFAEDIGKFPDTNIAESLNRIPASRSAAKSPAKAPTSRSAGWVPTSPVSCSTARPSRSPQYASTRKALTARSISTCCRPSCSPS